MIINGITKFKGRHDTGIHSDEIKIHICALQSILNFIDGKGVPNISIFIVAKTVYRSTAMIPHYQHISIRGIIFFGPVNEFGKCLSGSTVHLRQCVIHQSQSVFINKKTLGVIRSNIKILPLTGSHGLQYNVDFIAMLGINDFLNIICGTAVIGFQIGTVEIQHNGNRIFSVSYRCAKRLANQGEIGRIIVGQDILVLTTVFIIIYTFFCGVRRGFFNDTQMFQFTSKTFFINQHQRKKYAKNQQQSSSNGNSYNKSFSGFIHFPYSKPFF